MHINLQPTELIANCDYSSSRITDLHFSECGIPVLFNGYIVVIYTSIAKDIVLTLKIPFDYDIVNCEPFILADEFINRDNNVSLSVSRYNINADRENKDYLVYNNTNLQDFKKMIVAKLLDVITITSMIERFVTLCTTEEGSNYDRSCK